MVNIEQAGISQQVGTFISSDKIEGYGVTFLDPLVLGGDYEVLREKRTRYREKRLDAKIAPLGWLAVLAGTESRLPVWRGIDTGDGIHAL